MHEPGDKAILTDNGLAIAPGLHTLFDIGHTVVSTKNSFDFECFFADVSKVCFFDIIGLQFTDVL